MGNEVLKKYRRSKKGVLTNIYDHLKRRNKAKFGMELTFTSKEFQEKYIDDDDFLNIYNGWVDSGYQYYKKPSVDRKNPDEPYIFENMQFMTWEENRKKGEKERSRIVTSISMFDLDGKHIKDFDSVKQAVKETGLNESGIVSCCCGLYKHTGGYVFKYKQSGYQKTQNRIIHDTPEVLGGENNG